MKEIGTVVEKNDGYAVVNIQRKSMCGSCHSCELGYGDDQMAINVKAALKVDCNIGDTVYVSLNAPDILKASALAYGVPLFFLMSGFFITFYMSGLFLKEKSEIAGAVGSLIFMALSIIAVHFYDKKIKSSKKYEPDVVEVVHSGELKTLI